MIFAFKETTPKMFCDMISPLRDSYYSAAGKVIAIAGAQGHTVLAPYCTVLALTHRSYRLTQPVPDRRMGLW